MAGKGVVNVRTAVHIGLAFFCFSARLMAAGPGTTAANFTKIPVGARETALGGAFTSAAEGSGAVFYNPAGLDLTDMPELSYVYNKYLEGISQQWLAVSFPSGSGSFGVGVNFLNAGSMDSYDSSDNRTGTVSAYDLAGYFSYGSRLETGYRTVPSVFYGASVKYITEKLDTRKASAYGMDAGFIFLTGVKGLKAGMGLDNFVASRLKFIEEGAKLPFRFKTGVSYALAPDNGFSKMLFALDIGFPSDGPRYFSAGIEELLYGTLALRTGYSSFGGISKGLSFGCGVDMAGYTDKDIRLDYSFSSADEFGNIHKLGLTYKFGHARSQPQARAAEPQTVVPVPVSPEAIVQVSTTPVTIMPSSPVEQGQEDTFQRLLDMLTNEDPEVVKDGVRSMAGLNDARAVDPFIALLYSRDVGVRAAAVSGLMRQSGDRALAGLERGLRDNEPEVRLLAAQAIGARGNKNSVPALEMALKREEIDAVKNAIIGALEKLSSAQ